MGLPSLGETDGLCRKLHRIFGLTYSPFLRYYRLAKKWRMECQMSSPYIGTAGWSYPHWNGVVYPKSQAPGSHPLELLSSYMDLVEINSSFYHFLKPEVVRLWIKKVNQNPRFIFTAKLHQRFTHGRVLEDADVTAFKDGLAPLMRARKLG